MNQPSRQVTELPPKLAGLSAGAPVKAIIPQTFDDAFRLAKAVVAAGMAPKTLETEEKVAVAILHGMEVGLPPMMALQSIAVINGRPTIWGDGAMALVLASGQLESIEETIDGDGDNMIARCTVKRKGRAKPRVHDFSVLDAKRAGLWGKSGPWTTYPRRMIAMRPRSWCLRDEFADILKGLGITEEVMDTPEMKDISPVVVPPAPPPAPEEEPDTSDIPEVSAEWMENAQIVRRHRLLNAADEAAEMAKAGGKTDLPKGDVAWASYEDMIADWEKRLEAADPVDQDLIFEFEIDPRREAGEVQPMDYNMLITYLKSPGAEGDGKETT